MINLKAACGIVLLCQPLYYRERESKVPTFKVMPLVGEELRLGCRCLVSATSMLGAFLTLLGRVIYWLPMELAEEKGVCFLEIFCLILSPM